MSKKEIQDRWISQFRKGLLDFLILYFLKEQERYGYELIRDIKRSANMDISEGTIYPLLNRLMNDELVTSRWVEMGTGIPRKYYTITAKGIESFEAMNEAWSEISNNVNNLMVKQ